MVLLIHFGSLLRTAIPNCGDEIIRRISGHYRQITKVESNRVNVKCERSGLKLIINKIRPDTRRDSRGRSGRSGNAKSVTDGGTNRHGKA